MAFGADAPAELAQYRISSLFSPTARPTDLNQLQWALLIFCDF